MIRSRENGVTRTSGGYQEGHEGCQYAYPRPAVARIHIVVLCEGDPTPNNMHVLRDERAETNTRGEGCNGGVPVCNDEAYRHITKSRGRTRAKAIAFDIEFVARNQIRQRL